MSKLNNVYKSRFGEQLNKEKALALTPDEKELVNHTPSITPQTPKKSVISATKKSPTKQVKQANENIVSSSEIEPVNESVIDKSAVERENSTTQTVDSSSNTRTLREGTYTKSKTFFLPVEFHEMFEFIKWKKKMDHSKFAIQAIEQAFKDEFGENWRDLLKE